MASPCAAPFAASISEKVRDISPRRPQSPGRQQHQQQAVPAALPVEWMHRALNMLEGASARPTSARPSSPLHTSFSQQRRPPSSRPASASSMFPGYISSPGEQYAVPPAIVSRSINGYTEGQLQYQYGKLSPLTPSFAPSWVHDPPQRLNVNDLRLQPSQRSPSCYSPEFLTTHTGFTVDGTPPSADRPVTLSPTSPSSPRSPARPRTAPTTGGLSPPGQHRTVGHTHSMFTRSNPAAQSPLQPQQDTTTTNNPPTGQAWPARSGFLRRPHTAGSRHAPRPLTPQWVPSMGVCTRWGGKAAATTHPATNPPLHSAGQGGYFDGIRKGLAHSPMTDLVRTTAKSSFDTHGMQCQTLMTRAKKACQLARTRSARTAEGRMLVPGDAAARTTHYPQPTEAEVRAGHVATHEQRHVLRR